MLLLVEDNQTLAELTLDYLQSEGYECDYAAHGKQALQLITEHDYQLIILDVMMPKLDGFNLAQQLQQQQNTTPILFLTARDSLQDKLQGFELGAQDYLTKPFDLAELVARIKVITDRPLSHKQTIIELGSLVMNSAQHSAYIADNELILSPRLWQLLYLLATNCPNCMSKQQLEQHLWPNEIVTDGMLKRLISRLRQTLQAQPNAPEIATIRGIGFKLMVEDTTNEAHEN